MPVHYRWKGGPRGACRVLTCLDSDGLARDQWTHLAEEADCPECLDRVLDAVAARRVTLANGPLNLEWVLDALVARVDQAEKHTGATQSAAPTLMDTLLERIEALTQRQRTARAPRRDVLENSLQRYCEDTWSTGFLRDLEYLVWRRVIGEDDRYDIDLLPIALLAAQLNAWPVWNGHGDCDWRTLDEWAVLYAAWCLKQAVQYDREKTL